MRAELLQGASRCEKGRHGSEEVASVEGPAHGTESVPGLRHCHAPPLRCLRQHPGKHSVVRCNEPSSVGLTSESPTVRPHAWIHHHEMHGSPGIPPPVPGEDPTGLPHVPRGEVMGNVLHSDPRGPGRQDTLHGTNVTISGAEIRQNGDEGHPESAA